MKIKITKSTHVTQTEKKHIKQMLELGMTFAHTKMKSYLMTSVNDGKYCVTIKTKYRSDLGKLCYQKQNIEFITI